MSRYVTVDIGAESGRVIVITIRDGQVAIEEVCRFPNRPVQVGQSLYWDVLNIWENIRNGLLKVRSDYGADIASLAIDTWGIDYALLDRAGNLVSNPHTYRDPRTTGMLDIALERVSRWEIYQKSGGIQFMTINTLYQLLAMVEQKDPALESAQTFLMIPDLFNYWLTGQKVCEFTDATSTQFYNSEDGTWAYEVLDKMRIPKHLFPEIIMPGTRMGKLLPWVAKEVGLREIEVIACAAHDTASAIVAVPTESEQFAWLSSGTWSLLGGVTRKPIITAEALEYNFSSYGGAGGLFLPWKNIMGLWLLQECKRSWARQGQGISYESLSDLARKAQPFYAVIDPDDPSFLAPSDMPEQIQLYCAKHHQPVPEEIGQIVRIILESLALRYRWTFEKLAKLQGRNFESLHIVGGGSQNRFLCQLASDAVGVPVFAGPVEATAIGNAAVQAVATGELDTLEEARRVIRQSFDVQIYEPGVRDQWDEAYQQFETLL
jgi:rhamnulokinase